MGKFLLGKCGISDYIDLSGKELEKLGHSCQIKSIDSATGETFHSVARHLPLYACT
jgi:hypothetical protein